jgi:ferredoxin
VYCCGPEPLLQAVEAACASWPDGALHVERFQGAPLAAADGAVEPFEIQLKQSCRTLVVPPDRTILDVLEEAGIDVLSSCRTGTCGTCETEVLEGVPDHRDTVLTEEERDSGGVMMICASRSRSPLLVLDL